MTADAVPEPDEAPPPATGLLARYRLWWVRTRSWIDSIETEGWSRVSQDLIHWVTVAVPIGIVAGLGAALFFFLWTESTQFFLGYIVGIGYPIAGNPTTGSTVVWSSEFPRILLLPVVMTLGGLGTGLIAQKLAREVAGHGTDDTIAAFHNAAGRVRVRVPFLKILASALTLGSGGSGGREGPTSQIGGGFGSWWATLLRLDDRDRRIALATGLGAGIGAIFRAPLGGAIFAAEIMYTGDFEPTVFVPAIIASVVGYTVYGSFYGFSTLFASPSGLSWTPGQVPLYALLGILSAGVGVVFVRMFWRTKRRFDRIPWPQTFKTAAGAGASGVAILVVYFLIPWQGHFAALSAVNVGYGFVQAAMLGQVGLTAFAPLALVALGVAVALRMISTSLTVGSGGAAGLFGTCVVIGALLGSSIGSAFHWLVPAIVPVAAISAFSIVGMMAFFGGISKAPLAVLVMVVEMAGSYTLLAPAMIAIFIAYVATGRHHIYVAQVPTRLDSPAHRGEYFDYLKRQRPA